MDQVTRDLQGVYVYIDDILVVASNDVQHDQRLRALFQRLSEYGLVVNPAKSILGAQSVSFLGFQINVSGIRPLDDRVQAIRNFPEPISYVSLSEFLGMINFYHRFIPRCSHMARPLHDLVTKSRLSKSKAISAADWSPSCKTAFSDLKNAPARITTLAFPHPDLDTRLVTDASDKAVGAVLEQGVDHLWHPIAFFSKGLKTAELNYSTYDRELLAIKLSLIHFRHIVEGLPSPKFYVDTDHKPLTSRNHSLNG
jgi:cleavage and polyadenylation specificity factor subunit 1